MAKFIRWRHILLLLLSGATLPAADWSKLKLGMSALETSAILGEPLMRTAGQGFEVWIYDDQAEVVFYGPVVGWTTPRTIRLTISSHDVWSASSAPGQSAQVLPRPQPASQTPARRVTATKARLPAYR